MRIMLRLLRSQPVNRIILDFRNHLRSDSSTVRHAAACLGLLASLGSIQVARSDVINLIPVADTTLQETFPDSNYGLDGGIRAGGRQQGGIARGLMRFDIAGNLPAGATINSATLTMTVVGTSFAGVNSTFDVHRVLALWGEGASVGDLAVASWTNLLGPGTPWATAGGDFDSTASATQSVTGNGVYGFTSASLAADVSFWLTNAADNFGWLLRSESELTPVTIRKFGSREAPGSEPTLLVDYSTVTMPTIFALAPAGNQVRFSFNAESNRTYAVEFRDSLTAGDWSVLTNIDVLPVNATLDITNTLSSPQRYIRIRTP